METHPRNARGVACTVVALVVGTAVSAAHSQQARTQPAETQSAHDYFSRGADVTSVPRPGQPGADFFHRGADVTSVPRPGQPGADFFYRGADVTRVTVSAAPDVEAVEAEPTQDTTDESVVARAEPSHEVVHDVEEVEEEEFEDTTAETSPVDDALDGIVDLLPAWPSVVASSPDTDEPATDDASTLDRSDEVDDTTSPPDLTEDNPSLFDRLQSAVHHLALGARVVVVAITASIALLALAAWRALKRRHDDD